MVDVVVSWPANSSVMAWSRTSRSDSGVPSSSVAASSMPSMSWPGPPERRRRPISA